MKRYRSKPNILSLVPALILALSMLCAVGTVTAYAEPADGQVEQQVQEPAENSPAQDEPQEDPAQPQDSPPDQAQQEDPAQQDPAQQEQPGSEQEQPQEQSQEQQNEWYDYIYSYDEDADSAYEAPEHLDDLPAVSSSQVVEATAVAMPAVAVSDASLFSGIVMWLCVALGIAVIVGVLVSKRTRRRG